MRGAAQPTPSASRRRPARRSTGSRRCRAAPTRGTSCRPRPARGRTSSRRRARASTAPAARSRARPPGAPARGCRQRHGRQRADAFVGRGRRGTPSASHSRSRARSASARLRACSSGHPPGSSAAQVADALGQHQPGGRVVGAGPVELLAEAAAVLLGLVAVADHERVDARLAVAPHVQERGALGRAQPLVRVAGVVRGAQRVERRAAPCPARARRPPACRRRARASAAHQPLDREHEPGRAGHVVEQREPRARGHACEHALHDRRRPSRSGTGPRAVTTRAPAPSGDELRRLPAGAVRVVGREDLVARRELERAQHRVDAAGRVADEGEVPGLGAQERRHLRARVGEPPAPVARQEVDRLALHLAPQLPLPLEDRARARAERAVVQVRDVGVERPEGREGGGGHPRIMASKRLTLLAARRRGRAAPPPITGLPARASVSKKTLLAIDPTWRTL